MTCFFAKIERNSGKNLQRSYLQNQKHFLELLLHFWNLHKILSILSRRDDIDKFNISGVIDSEICSYLNARKVLFLNILWR